MGSDSLSSNSFLELNTYQITRYPVESPVIKYFPEGLTSIASTEALWPWYVIFKEVGKGLSCEGSGILGMSY